MYFLLLYIFHGKQLIPNRFDACLTSGSELLLTVTETIQVNYSNLTASTQVAFDTASCRTLLCTAFVREWSVPKWCQNATAKVFITRNTKAFPALVHLALPALQRPRSLQCHAKTFHCFCFLKFPLHLKLYRMLKHRNRDQNFSKVHHFSYLFL